jgi:hypothetical protein
VIGGFALDCRARLRCLTPLLRFLRPRHTVTPELPCTIEKPHAAPAHPCARGIPHILCIKKSGRGIFLDIPYRFADVSPPANASVPLKVQHFLVLSQILLLTKKPIFPAVFVL